MFKAIFFRGVQYNIFKQLREISVSIKKKGVLCNLTKLQRVMCVCYRCLKSNQIEHKTKNRLKKS